jgi:hypothetical protein
MITGFTANLGRVHISSVKQSKALLHPRKTPQKTGGSQLSRKGENFWAIVGASMDDKQIDLFLRKVRAGG